jgi:hypothetical protein
MNALRVLRRLRGYRPRYADVTATLALMFAMGGTAYAATSLGPHTVGTLQLKNHAVTAGKVHERAVTTPKLEPGAVTDAKLADAAVTHSKLGANSIDGSNVASGSLSLSDLVGADTSGSISFSLGADTCGTLTLGVSGAQVGQAVLFSFTGNTAVPSSVAFGGTKVTATGTVTVRACNVSATSFSVSNLGIRLVTFG